MLGIWLALAMASEGDRDSDGIPDATDVCPNDPEVMNGFRDGDGCPDKVATVTITATNDGEPADEAAISVTGPTGTWSGIGTVVAPLIPEADFVASAVVGACWSGNVTFQVGSEDKAVEVPLASNATSTVRYAVFDSAGKPLSDTTVTVLGSGSCRPPPGRIGEKAVHRLGGGDYEVLVSAGGQNWHRESFHLEPGHDKLVIARLKPTKVVVTGTQIEIMEKVYFDTGKASIKPVSFALLDEVANTVLAYEMGALEVQGHTDSQGSESYNLELSARRAEAVRAYLVGKGVPAERLTSRGMGESMPLADNGSPAGREQNRRVEFHIR